MSRYSPNRLRQTADKSCRLQFYIFVITCMAYASPARADFVISFDMDSTMPGIQSDRAISAGNFTVDIVGSLTGGDSLALYSFLVEFDTAELAVAGVTQPSPPLGFDGTLATPAVNGNQIETFAAFTNFGSPDVTGNFLAGTIEFTPLAVSGAVGDPDLRVFTRPIIDGALDGLSNPLAIGSSPGGVSAVPEPSSILMGFTVFALVCFRRWLMVIGIENGPTSAPKRDPPVINWIWLRRCQRHL